MPTRRFPPPWSIEELEACLIVKDGAEQKLAFVYFEEEPGRRTAAKLLTKDEARRIAIKFAKLPELLRKSLWVVGCIMASVSGPLKESRTHDD